MRLNNKELIIKFDELEQYIYKYYINECHQCNKQKNNCNILIKLLPIELTSNIKNYYCCYNCSLLINIINDKPKYDEEFNNVMISFNDNNPVNKQDLINTYEKILSSYYIDKLTDLQFISRDEIISVLEIPSERVFITEYNKWIDFYKECNFYYYKYAEELDFYKLKEELKNINYGEYEEIPIKYLINKYFIECIGNPPPKKYNYFHKDLQQHFLTNPIFQYLKITKKGNKYYCNKIAVDKINMNRIIHYLNDEENVKLNNKFCIG